MPGVCGHGCEAVAGADALFALLEYPEQSALAGYMLTDHVRPVDAASEPAISNGTVRDNQHLAQIKWLRAQRTEICHSNLLAGIVRMNTRIPDSR